MKKKIQIGKRLGKNREWKAVADYRKWKKSLQKKKQLWKAAMHSQAERRIGDLQSRGYANAGLYDPQGVGGTHVMYVLHHADKPSLYKGLPDDPKISPMVALWKGVAKPLAMAALGAAAVGSLFHYITKGPNEVSKELEDEMERKDQQAAEKETQP